MSIVEFLDSLKKKEDTVYVFSLAKRESKQ